MSLRPVLLVAAVLFAAGCGGGGGGMAPPVEIGLDLGLVPAADSATRPVAVGNPVQGDASVELVGEPAGPFAPAPGALPAVAPAAGELRVDVVYTPPATAGAALEGGFTLRFTGPRETRDVELTLAAERETPTVARASPARLDFGGVRIGDSATRSIAVVNTSLFSDAVVTSISSLPDGFSWERAPLPVTLAPGERYTAGLRYEPDELGAPEFAVAVSHATGADLVTTVAARTDTWIPRMVTEFGAVAVAGRETGWLEVEAPPHAVALSIEAYSDAATIGLLGLEGPGGHVYENADATGLYLWTPGAGGVFTATVPQSDRPEVRLKGGGTYRFRLFALDGDASSFDVRAIVRNRLGGISRDGVLELNVFLPPALAGEEGGERFAGVLDETDRILAQQGVRLGTRRVFLLDDDRFDEIDDGGEFRDLLRESAGAPDRALNLFFVRRALGNGVLGVAARITGPERAGTDVSGVMVDYDFGSVATAGHVTAHEIGHYLGLFHTTESNGSHDIIDDTLECPATGTDEVCAVEGNGNLMHWRVLPDDALTDGQGVVLRAHPLVRPGASTLARRLAPPAPGEKGPVPPGWCATAGCRACAPR